MTVGKVWNRSSRRCPDDAVNIMRGTPYGNPFIIGVHGDREEVCRRFRVEVLPKLDLTPLIDKDLMCCCKPKMCHGDDLAVWAWFRKLQAMARKAKEIGPQVFMEQKALAFIRAFPNVPDGLVGVWVRVYNAGLVWSDPNHDVDWDRPTKFPFALSLTRAGQVLQHLLQGQTYNMFSEEDVVAVRDLITPGERVNVFGEPTGESHEEAHKARLASFQALWKDELPKFQGSWPTGMPGGPGLGLNSAIRELKLALAENRKARRGK